MSIKYRYLNKKILKYHLHITKNITFDTCRVKAIFSQRQNF